MIASDRQLDRHDDQTLLAGAEAIMRTLANRHRDSELFEVYELGYATVKTVSSVNISQPGRRRMARIAG